jgi:DNA-binding HxlR family transcriptional regulator
MIFLNITVPNVQQVLEAIADDISVNIFTNIERSTKNTNDLKQELNLGSKQFYDRVQKLIDADLVKRRSANYYTTSLGRLTFQAYARIATAIENLQQLKIVDSILSSNLPTVECEELIDRLINDIEIKKIISNGDRKE